MSAFDEMMGGRVNGPIEIGLTEIVGDRVVMVPDVDKPKQYLEGKYTIQDRIDLGSPQNDNVAIAAFPTTRQFACSSPFKPEELIIDSATATDLSIMDVAIGSSRYTEGGPVPGAVYSEVALSRRVSWRTVQTTVPILITVRNDTANPVIAKLCIRGLRLV